MAGLKQPLLQADYTSPQESFKAIGVEPFLVNVLKQMSIKLPTEVQAACIPAILEGRDCIGNAQTGSGKTFAFALPIVQNLVKDPFGLYAVVLTPTRELAFQIHEQFKALGTAASVSSAVVVGGMDMMQQAQEMAARPHVVIATPGRLVDLLRNSHGQWDLTRARYLVLDEADRLLAPSFSEDLATIIRDMPKARQTLLFTATMNEAIESLRQKEPAPGKQPIFVHLSRNVISTPSQLKRRFIFVPSQVRDCYLYYLLKNLATLTDTRPMRRTVKKANKKRSRSETSHRVNDILRDTETLPEGLPQTIIFVSRCKSAAHLSFVLDDLDIDNAPLHSHLTQKERLASLAAFRACSVPLLIATDVGSRGLDIPEVAVVINWDLPREPDDYVHRVGRTARAGKSGTAISFVAEGDVDLVSAIENRVGAKMEELVLPEEPVLENLNKVATSQRIATVQMRSEKMGERQLVHRKKAAALERPMKRRKREVSS